MTSIVAIVFLVVVVIVCELTLHNYAKTQDAGTAQKTWQKIK